MAIDKTINLNVNAKKAIKDTKELKEEVQGVDKAANESKGGFFNMAEGVTAVGMAFKAAGIGLIMTAFIGVKDAIFQNQGALDSINKKIEEFRYYARRAAESLSNFKQSIADAFSFDRKNPISEFFQAGLLLQKNFGKDWMDQVEKGTLNIEKALKEMGISAAATQMFLLHLQRENENIDFGIVGAKEYADTLVELRKEVQLAEASQRLLQVTYQKDAEIQRQIRDDITKTHEERMTASQNLGGILEKQFAEEKALAQKRFDLAKMERDENEGNVALEVAFINAKTELATIEERIEIQRSEHKRSETALIVEQKAVIDETIAAQNKQLDDEIMAFAKKERLRHKELADQELAARKEKKIAEDLAKAKLQIERDAAQMKRDIVANSLGAVASLIGEETKAGKALAIAQAYINMYSAATAALAPPPLGAGPVFGKIAAVGAIAAGLANIKSIINTQLPGVDDSGDSEGGGTPAVPGFVGDLVPNMESIEQPELGGATPIQAYVVENDISNAQALQEELEIQSTL